MNPNPESDEGILETLEVMCICEDCPTYTNMGKKDDYITYCYHLRGKSKKIKKEVKCLCPDCPVLVEMGYTKTFYCTRGSEKEQKGK